jgi:hypothetical protein
VLFAAPTLEAAWEATKLLFGEAAAQIPPMTAERALLPFDVEPLGMQLTDMHWLTSEQRGAAPEGALAAGSGDVSPGADSFGDRLCCDP